MAAPRDHCFEIQQIEDGETFEGAAAGDGVVVGLIATGFRFALRRPSLESLGFRLMRFVRSLTFEQTVGWFSSGGRERAAGCAGVDEPEFLDYRERAEVLGIT
ncbi:MAG: hypothetical protein JJE39_04415 [Vicinamibacteria bacterium]|nr:hypothetical protein [Vicinamibacteria bacterium]